jgi:hypothetical protein
MYSTNIALPSNLDIRHLETAMDTITAISIKNNMTTEQNSPSLLTLTDLPKLMALNVIHGRGSLK